MLFILFCIGFASCRITYLSRSSGRLLPRMVSRRTRKVYGVPSGDENLWNGSYCWISGLNSGWFSTISRWRGALSNGGYSRSGWSGMRGRLWPLSTRWSVGVSGPSCFTPTEVSAIFRIFGKLCMTFFRLVKKSFEVSLVAEELAQFWDQSSQVGFGFRPMNLMRLSECVVFGNSACSIRLNRDSGREPKTRQDKGTKLKRRAKPAIFLRLEARRTHAPTNKTGTAANRIEIARNRAETVTENPTYLKSNGKNSEIATWAEDRSEKKMTAKRLEIKFLCYKYIHLILLWLVVYDIMKGLKENKICGIFWVGYRFETMFWCCIAEGRSRGSGSVGWSSSGSEETVKWY